MPGEKCGLKSAFISVHQRFAPSSRTNGYIFSTAPQNMPQNPSLPSFPSVRSGEPIAANGSDPTFNWRTAIATANIGSTSAVLKTWPIESETYWPLFPRRPPFTVRKRGQAPSVRSGAEIRPAFGPPVSGDACVALGRRFCVLQRQRGASPAANQDAGLICAPILSRKQQQYRVVTEPVPIFGLPAYSLSKS